MGRNHAADPSQALGYCRGDRSVGIFPYCHKYILHRTKHHSRRWRIHQFTFRMAWILTFLGIISLIMGIMGAFVPVLPTTPFLLLSAALFLRGNRKLYEWLMNHPRMGVYISNFVVHRSIPLRVKIISVLTLWITLLYCAFFVASHWAFSTLFIVIAIGVTIHILSYKTLR